MNKNSVEKMMIYGLRSCLDGPKKRHLVTESMRNCTPQVRREAVRRIVEGGFTKLREGESARKGRTAVMVEITEKGRQALRDLESLYPTKPNTIWG